MVSSTPTSRPRNAGTHGTEVCERGGQVSDIIKIASLVFVAAVHAWIAAERGWWWLCGVMVFLTVVGVLLPLLLPLAKEREDK